jgi:hypothetical protein
MAMTTRPGKVGRRNTATVSMWRSARGLNADRGQARIPSVEIMQGLIARARKEGWADFDGDALSAHTRAKT